MCGAPGWVYAAFKLAARAIAEYIIEEKRRRRERAIERIKAQPFF